MKSSVGPEENQLSTRLQGGGPFDEVNDKDKN
jgi:hypothetical protein